MQRTTNKLSLPALLLLFSLLFAAPTSAAILQSQPPRQEHKGKRPPFDPREFRKHIEQFITQEACLTPKEAHNFFPLYHSMKEQQRNIQGKIFRATIRVEKEKLSDADCRRILAQIQKYQEQLADIEKRYMNKFAKVLPPQKLLKVLNAEHKFGREMFRKGPRK